MANQERDDGQHRMQLRMPDELAKFLKHQAIDNHRSLNSEVVHRLEQTMRQKVTNAQPA